MRDGEIATDTLGTRILQGLRERHPGAGVELPWLRSLQPLLRRVASLPTPHQSRFERVEVGMHPLPPAEGAGMEGAPLSWRVRERLSEEVGPAARTLRVHDGAGADMLAREHGADAVAVGRDVFFRRGRFQPETPRGLALLAHEAVHVEEALRPNAAWRRATGTGEEEGAARAVESRLLASERAPVLPTPPIHAGRDASAPAPAAPASSSQASPASRPMTAATARTSPAEPAPAPPVDTEALRRSLYRDLLAQIRTEMERGG